VPRIASRSNSSSNSNLSYFFSKSGKNPHYEEASDSSIQMPPSKIIFWNISEIKNFGEFMKILPNALMLLKIQTIFRIVIYSRIVNSKSVPNLKFTQ
jgi:hypothetical protein